MKLRERMNAWLPAFMTGSEQPGWFFPDDMWRGVHKSPELYASLLTSKPPSVSQEEGTRRLVSHPDPADSSPRHHPAGFLSPPPKAPTRNAPSGIRSSRIHRKDLASKSTVTALTVKATECDCEPGATPSTLRRGALLPPGDTWQCQELSVLITTERRGLLLGANSEPGCC